MTTTALVSTGIVNVCCGSHRPAGCCDPDDCSPCCAECPTCPLYKHWTPEQRRAAVARWREYLAELLDMQRAANRAWAQHRRNIAVGTPTPIYATTVQDTGITPDPAVGLELWPALELDRPPFRLPDGRRSGSGGGA